MPYLSYARVAKLVDALDLGSSAYGVGVQVPPRAPQHVIIRFFIISTQKLS